MRKHRSSWLGFIVVLLLVFACCRCGSDRARQETSSTPRALVSSPSPAPTAAPVATSTVRAVLAAPTVDDAPTNTATIIGDNADFRATANRNGTIIEKLTVGTGVKVIRQKGAWFLVRNNGREGWLHGNSIQLRESVPDKAPASALPLVYSKPERSSAPAKEINNSGASARCRDGSLSYSAHRRGTCSHHGGVAEWF